jgi:hypothetical protein
MVLSAGTFVSCKDDTDDLKNRITVLEGLIDEIKAAQSAGMMVTNATQNADGSWTLTLTGGQIINTGVGSGGGGGADITVADLTNAYQITINGVGYILMKAEGALQLVFASESIDPTINIEDTPFFKASFLAKGLTQDALAAGTWDIATATELRALGGATGNFTVDGDPTLDGDFVHVPLLAVDGTIGSTYAIAISMTLNGATYVSNFFNVVLNTTPGMPEDLVAPVFTDKVTNVRDLGNGVWAATLPNAVDLISGINFNELVTPPAPRATGDVRFVMAPYGQQNSHVNTARYNVLRSSLAQSGQFEFAGRIGHTLNLTADQIAEPGNEGKSSGFKVNVIVAGTIVNSFFIDFIDPIADLDFGRNTGAGGEAEYDDRDLGGGPLLWAAGAGTFDWNHALNNPEGIFGLRHGDGLTTFLTDFESYAVNTDDGQTLVANDGERLVMGNLGELLATHSRGIHWSIGNWVIIAQEGTETLPGTPTPDSAGGTSGSWDGITQQKAADLGMSMRPDGVMVFTDAYLGWGFRARPRIQYEYMFGSKNLVSREGWVGFIFFNRRVKNVGVANPT